MPVLHPGEHPGNGPQVLDGEGVATTYRPRAGVELGDLLDRRRLLEVGLEAGVLVDQLAILPAALVRHRVHRPPPRRMRPPAPARHPTAPRRRAPPHPPDFPPRFRARH